MNESVGASARATVRGLVIRVNGRGGGGWVDRSVGRLVDRLVG